MIKQALAFFIGLSTILISCNYQNEEELFPTTSCDTENLSYAGEITDILTNYNCLSCHSNTSSQGGVNLEGYTALKVWVDNELLLKSIKHDGASPMPKNQAKMNACDIDKIEGWINDGAPNN
jgi:mono/diheme cytochrome c family protein